MTVLGIRAFLTCDGCGEKMSFDIDAATKAHDGWTMFDIAVDAVRGGHVREGIGLSSVQGTDKCLCPKCTSTVDDFVTEDRDATDGEIKAALDAELFPNG